MVKEEPEGPVSTRRAQCDARNEAHWKDIGNQRIRQGQEAADGEEGCMTGKSDSDSNEVMYLHT